MKVWGWIVAVCLVICAALAAHGFRRLQQVHAVQQAEDLRAIQGLLARATSAERLAAEAASRAQEQEKRAVSAEARLARAPRPAPPAAPPLQDADLAHGLVLAGLGEGLIVRPVQPSGLLPDDAREVWKWKENANRVPGLELRLGAAEDAADARKAQAEELQVALGKSMEATEAQKAAVEVSRRARDAAMAQAEWESVKKWGWGFGGVVTGVLIGRAIR